MMDKSFPMADINADRAEREENEGTKDVLKAIQDMYEGEK